MRIVLGIDLGSTTTKAVVLDEDRKILGRGITNSRSNYDVACAVAKNEALVDARFTLLRRRLPRSSGTGEGHDRFLSRLDLAFRLEQYLGQMDELESTCVAGLDEPRLAPVRTQGTALLNEVFGRLRKEAPALYVEGARRPSDFFRDLAGARFLSLAETSAKASGVPFETMMGIYDKSILRVENRVPDSGFEAILMAALDRVVAAGAEREQGSRDGFRTLLEAVAREPLVEFRTVGTGYGRARLPFPRECIRSEILCHGLGAHAIFPGTRTVLDIGGQDTKAIQIDDLGLVTSFQMNDRCAAGCGRYLGYIADEMNLGVQEIGPMALRSEAPARITSTCTVFAGAELRDQLALGAKREDILAGLHRAIILRALSLLARSGGIRDEFTFTGGVAKNGAAVKALTALVKENYGEITLNISADSIYTGALGAALFAHREAERPALTEAVFDV